MRGVPSGRRKSSGASDRRSLDAVAKTLGAALLTANVENVGRAGIDREQRQRTENAAVKALDADVVSGTVAVLAVVRSAHKLIRVADDDLVRQEGAAHRFGLLRAGLVGQRNELNEGSQVGLVERVEAMIMEMKVLIASTIQPIIPIGKK
eukprot:gnl/Ergobibamus_cyprinoides/4096.p1 GENE.gnl/Ergobibamus_cyprinoides/4096~~gnl/Ergobibamus_cyprinoides/4096.p1  ORF type:complete len:150 (-),score=5.63 gnl/Ergobibamus_cyprinoides/4096:32-481(-)